MPHQCVRCNTFYDDGSEEILKGCSCGGKLFFYVRKEKIEQAKKIVDDAKLTEKEKEQVEKDVFEIVGSDIDKEEPVILDLESIRVTKPGKYELDLVHLFKGDPLIFKLEEGRYMIDLVETFKRAREKKI
jgi:predicted  nucleic acid-binding Zn-ribbon protein